MKTNKLLAVVALTATLSFAVNASAQYQATGDDGVTASPKVRAFLDGQIRSGSAPGDKIDRLLVGIPKVNARLKDAETSGSAPGDKIDRSFVGIPKVRDQHASHLYVAPLK